MDEKKELGAETTQRSAKEKLNEILGNKDGVYHVQRGDEMLVYKRSETVPSSVIMYGQRVPRLVEVFSAPRSEDEITVEIAHKAMNNCVVGNWKDAMALGMLGETYFQVVGENPDVDMSRLIPQSMEAELRMNTNKLIKEIAIAKALNDVVGDEEIRSVLLEVLKKSWDVGSGENPELTSKIFSRYENSAFGKMLDMRDDMILKLVAEKKINATDHQLRGINNRKEVRDAQRQGLTVRAFQAQRAEAEKFPPKKPWWSKW